MSFAAMTTGDVAVLDAFVAQLRATRLRKGLYLRHVAAALGVPASTVRNWESGARRPRHDLLVPWAAYLEVEIPTGVHGWLPSVSPCGTLAAAQAHRRRGETPCTPCQEAHNTYQRDWRTARRRQ